MYNIFKDDDDDADDKDDKSVVSLMMIKRPSSFQFSGTVVPDDLKIFKLEPVDILHVWVDFQLGNGLGSFSIAFPTVRRGWRTRARRRVRGQNLPVSGRRLARSCMLTTSNWQC